MITHLSPELHLTFWCPGCDHGHTVPVDANDINSWGWNGDRDKPTLQPSVLVYSRGELIDESLPFEKLLDPSNIRQTPNCHSFVRDGQITFLDDSTHALASMTVDLPELPDRPMFREDA